MSGLMVGLCCATISYRRTREPIDLRRPELWVYDQMSRYTASRDEGLASEPVVVVNIDDSTLEEVYRKYGATWPWPRALLGRGAEELARLGARAVILEGSFASHDAYGPADERELVDHLRQAGMVVVPAQISERDMLPALPRGRWAARLGSFEDRSAALGFAADLEANQGAAFLLKGSSGGPEVWLGGLATRAEVEAKVAATPLPLGAHKPADPEIRELSLEEMSHQARSEDWVEPRDALEVPGIGSLAIPEFDAWVLPQPEIAAAVRHVAFANDPVHTNREGVDVVSDFDPVEREDYNVPSADVQRSVRLFVKKEGKVYPTLPLAALLVSQPDLTLAVEGSTLVVGSQRIPLSRRGFMQVTYPSESAFFGGGKSEIPFVRLLESADRREKGAGPTSRLESEIKGKLVVIANLAAESPDRRSSPIPGLPGPSGVVASAARTLVTGHAIERGSSLGDAYRCLVLALLGCLFGFGVFRTTRTWLFTVVVGGAGAVLLVGLEVFAGLHDLEVHRVWRAVFWPGVSFIASSLVTAWINYGEENAERARLVEVLGRFVRPPTVNRLLVDPSLLSPVRRDLTVFFCDIIGFTGLTESMPARRLSQLLDAYFTAMAEIIGDAGGHIDQFIGDAITAFWNAPLPIDRHPEQACRAALKMRDRLVRLRPDLKSDFDIELRVRMGLATGEVVVGELGAYGDEGRGHTHYTAVGESVNLGSQMERANREYGTEILVSESTWAQVGDKFEMREVDRILVKGVVAPVRIFQLQAERGRLSDAERTCNELYAQGLASYRARKFDEARRLFRDAAAAFAGDGPATVMADRCSAYVSAPPPASWDGTFRKFES